MIETILRKARIKSFAYSVLRKSLINDEPCALSVEEAIKLLESFSPDPKNSCIERKKIKSPEYDLEIIIPAYNVEKFIQQCLDSVVSQKTDFSFHVTCVDDGSTDNTGALLDKYSSGYVSIIHQSNRGISGARNAALRKTNGKYIMFVDSDDFLPQGTVQSMLNNAFNNDADIVWGGGMNA